MEALRVLVMTLPLSLTAGLNLYATVLVVGLCVRFGWVSEPPQALSVLASWPVIIVAGVMYVIEFFADKIQFIDNLWDLVHTLIRPVGAILIAVIATYGEGSPEVTVIAALLAGTVSFIAHTGKAGTRVMVNLVSPHENLSNTGLSVAEDVAAAGLAALAMTHPYVAAVVSLAILAFIVFALPRLMRWGLYSLGAAMGRVVAAFRVKTAPDLPPAEQLAMLGHPADLFAVRTKACRVRKAAGRSGYLAVLGNRVVFTYRKWFVTHRLWEVALADVQAAYFRRRWNTDCLELHFTDARKKPRTVRFLISRYRSPLAEELGRRMKARGLPGTAPGEAIEGRAQVVSA
jgi:hypothetical protein